MQLAFRGASEEIKSRIEEASSHLSAASILKSVDEDGRTAVHWAASGGHANLLAYLLSLLDAEEAKCKLRCAITLDGRRSTLQRALVG